MTTFRNLVFVVLGVLVACGDPYAGEAPGPADAGGSDGPVSLLDAASDTAVVDAGTDGAADAGPGCGWLPLDDAFDAPSFASFWTRDTDGSGLKIEIVGAPSLSGGSLAAELLANDSGALRHDYLSHTLTVTASAPVPGCATMTFALLVQDFSGPATQIAALHLDNDTVVTVWLYSNEIELVAQSFDGSTFQSLLKLPMSVGGWHTVMVHHDTGVPTPTMSVDGKTGVSAAATIALGLPQKFRTGIGFARAATSAHYFIENVSVR